MMMEKTVDAAILTDSKSSVGTAHNSVSARYRYLSVYVAFRKRFTSRKLLKIIFLGRENNLADLLRKQSESFTVHRLLRLALSPFEWIHQTASSAKEKGRSETQSLRSV